MKENKQWIAALLTVAMMLPVFMGMMPLAVNAAEGESGSYMEFFDFEDALDDEILPGGVLSDTYVEDRLNNRNFSTIKTGDGFYTNSDRRPEQWKVVRDETTGRIYLDQRTKEDGASKTGDFAMFTLRDKENWLWGAPYEISFDFRPNYCKNTAALVHVTHNKFLTGDVREGLINVKGNESITYVSTSSSSFKITLTNGEWYHFCVRVNPATGFVQFWVKDMNGESIGYEQKTSSKVKNFAALENIAASAISIGYGWGSSVIQNFSLDNICLASPATVNEEQTFSDVYDSADLYINSQIKSADTSFTAYNFSKNSTTNPYLNYLTVATEADGNKYLREYIPKEASYKYGTEGGGTVENGGDGKNYHFAAGINFQNPELLNEKFEISIDYKYDAITTGSSNVIRFEGSGNNIVAPLVIHGGGRVTTTSNWYIVLRKTEEGYKTYSMTRETWHTFRVVVDPATSEYEMFITVGDGAEERLYFLKSPKGSNIGTNWTTVYTEDQVKETANFTDYGSKYDMSKWTSLKIWLIHGTNNFVSTNKSHDFHADDISIKTVNSTKVAELFDFENYAPYTFGWDKNTFSVVNSNSNSAPVTDWEVVNDPKGTRGVVLHTKPKDGRTSSIFSLRDINNALPGHAFDLSFDLYLPKAPNNSVNLLKIYTAYNDSTGKYDTTKYFTPFVMNGYLSLMYGTSDENVATEVPTTLTTGKWYTLRARIDLEKGEYSTYVDDVCIQTNKIDDVYAGKNMLATINKMQIEICSQWSVTQGPKAEYYLDNVRLTTVKEVKQIVDEDDITEYNYDLIAADFEDGGEWLTKAEDDEITFLDWGYGSAALIENAGVAGNGAVDLSGSVGGTMNINLPLENTFVIEASLCYDDPFGASMTFAEISDPAIEGGKKTLLSIKGQTASDQYNGALYFVENGICYYICDAGGNLLTVSAPHTETADFTDVALFIDAATNQYSVYVNGKPAYYVLDGKAARATGISLGLSEDKTAFESPTVDFIKCPESASSKFHLYIDNIGVSVVKNGLAPVLVGYQENYSSTGAIRFLATVDTLYYQSVGFEVTALGVTKEVSGDAVYTSVMAGGETYTAGKFDGRYLTALVITGIDQEGVSFEVRPFVTFFGQKVYGTSETMVFNGAVATPAAE